MNDVKALTVSKLAAHVGGRVFGDGALLIGRIAALEAAGEGEIAYVEDEKFFEALDPSEQRKRIKTARSEELKTILQSTLVSFGLDFRILAEEISTADDKMLKQIARMVAEERITLSYSILPDRAFEYVLAELKRINKTVMEQWGSEKSS